MLIASLLPIHQHRQQRHTNIQAIRRLAEEIALRVNPQVKIQYLPYREAYGADFEDVRRRVPDLTRLEQTIGQKPRMSLGEILDDVIRHKRQAAAAQSQKSVAGSIAPSLGA